MIYNLGEWLQSIKNFSLVNLFHFYAISSRLALIPPRIGIGDPVPVPEAKRIFLLNFPLVRPTPVDG